MRRGARGRSGLVGRQIKQHSLNDTIAVNAHAEDVAIKTSSDLSVQMCGDADDANLQGLASVIKSQAFKLLGFVFTVLIFLVLNSTSNENLNNGGQDVGCSLSFSCRHGFTPNRLMR